MVVDWVGFCLDKSRTSRQPGNSSNSVRCITLEPDIVWNLDGELPTVYWPLNIGHDDWQGRGGNARWQRY